MFVEFAVSSAFSFHFLRFTSERFVMFFDYKKAVFFSVFLLFSSFAFGQIAGDFRPAQGPLAKPIPAAGSLDRVKVVEVFSFTCPHCHRLNNVWSSFYEKFKDKIDSHHYEIGWAGPNPGKFYYLANSLEKGQRSRDIVFLGVSRLQHPQHQPSAGVGIFLQRPQNRQGVQSRVQLPQVAQKCNRSGRTTSASSASAPPRPSSSKIPSSPPAIWTTLPRSSIPCSGNPSDKGPPSKSPLFSPSLSVLVCRAEPCFPLDGSFEGVVRMTF